MGRFRPRAHAVAVALAAVALAGCGDDATAGAEGQPPPVTDAFVPVPPNPDVAAVYLDIGDPGGQDDLLIAARTDVADRVELHESVVADDGTARMEPRSDGIEVPAGQGVALEPGGLHVMLFHPDPLAEGDTFDLVLDFDRGGQRTVEVVVTGGAGDHGGEGDDDHG